MARSDALGFIQRSVERVLRDGLDGVTYFTRNAYESVIRHGLAPIYWPEGTPIFETEWDVLVILDACRADMLREVQDEYEFLDTPGTQYSVDSASRTWMQKNFRADYADEMERTAYVTGNPYSDEVVNDDEFARVEEVWKDSWNDELGTVLPRPITDRTIAVHRELDPDRLLVHYMQPHYPFVQHQEVDDGISLDFFRPGSTTDSTDGDDVWEQFRTGQLTGAEVWALYLDNLRYVLDELRLLRRNVDAETLVISADHGNAFGEFGIYAHPPGMPFKSVREVPWYVTSATDTGEYVPETASSGIDDGSDTVNERLRDLGYL